MIDDLLINGSNFSCDFKNNQHVKPPCENRISNPTTQNEAFNINKSKGSSSDAADKVLNNNDLISTKILGSKLNEELDQFSLKKD